MTIGGWIGFAIISFIVAAIGVACICMAESVPGKVLSGVVSGALILALLFGLRWYYGNTASGQRALVDQKSNVNNGIERVITVYTAGGDVIATYAGKIDIADSDGGYIKFDFEGKRYIYYNCFVESIANIE